MWSFFELLSIVLAIVLANCSHSNGTRVSLPPQEYEAKVRAGAPFLGYYSECEGTLCDWQAKVPDNTQLVHMSIPGTHDTATWNYTDATEAEYFNITGPIPHDATYYRCQDAPIFDMLNAGIRALDLRWAYSWNNESISFWHAEALLSTTATLEDTLYGLYFWLDHHPSETIIVFLQLEGTPHGVDDQRLQTMMYDLLDTDDAKAYWVREDSEFGSLGEARGKLLLIKRFDFDLLAPTDADRFGLHFSPADWTDNSANFSILYNPDKDFTLYGEDLYQLTTGGTAIAPKVNEKLNATLAHLDLARGPLHADSLFISFGSTAADPEGATPEMLALGNNGTTGVNQWLKAYFQGHRGSRFGVVMFDFYAEVPDLLEAFLGF